MGQCQRASRPDLVSYRAEDGGTVVVNGIYSAKDVNLNKEIC